MSERRANSRARPQQVLVDRAAFGFGRQMGCERSGKALRANGRQLARLAGRLPQSQRVVGNQFALFAAAATGRRLIDPHPALQVDQVAGNQCRHIRLARRRYRSR